MSIYGNGAASNTLIGTFTIYDIQFGSGSSIDSFFATFEQHSEGAEPALSGTISYHSDYSPVPEPSSIALFSIGIIGALGILRNGRSGTLNN